MDSREKMRTKYHFHRPGVDAFNTAKTGASQKPAQVSYIRSSRNLWWRSSFVTWPIIYVLQAVAGFLLDESLKNWNELRHNFYKIG